MKPLRAGGTVSAALTLLGLAILPFAANPATAASTAKDPPPVGITLESQPAWVTPGRPTPVTVDVTHPPTGGEVQAQLHDTVSSRAQLRGARAGRQLGPVLDSLQPKPLTVAPGAAQTRVQLEVRLTDHDHPLAGAPCANGCRPGVYSVDIQVHDHAGRIQAQLVTFLLLLPPAPTPLTPQQPLLHVALVVPIASNPPTLRSDGRRALAASARQRLTRTLTALTTGPGSLLPSTLVPSPELVQTIGASDTTLRDRLVAAAAGRQMLAPPFVPFDQPAWARQPRLTALSAEQVATGRYIITALDPKHSPDTATWIASGDIDNGALSQLAFQGFKHLLVPDEALPDTSDGSALTRPFRLSGDPTGRLQAVIADTTMRDEAGARDSLLGVQTLLADLTIVSEESNSSGRGVAVVLPDQWNPSTAALDQLIKALTNQPPGTGALMQPVTVNQLFATPSGTATPGNGTSGNGTSGGSTAGSTSEQLATRQLIGSPRSAAGFAARVAHTSQLLNAYHATFAGASTSPGAASTGLARVADLDARVRTAGFSGFNDATRNRRLTAVDADIADDLGRIAVPQRQTITLTARSGKIPFTIRNGTGAPIQVMVAVESNERVTFPSTKQFVTVPGEVSRIDFHVHTRTTGDTPVQVGIWTPDGSTEIATSRITVRSTAVSGVGLVVTIGAGAFLVVWWLSHWRRSRKRRGNAPAARPPTPPQAPVAPTAVGAGGRG